MQKGKLYGVGTGPGDPQLLTLKAVSVIQKCEYIAVPGKVKEQTTAYKIVIQALPEIAKKPCLCIPMPMTKDRKKLADSHAKGAAEITQILDQGACIAFLTLGDPVIYSTYLYLHKRILAAGYDAKIISGVPSFCAAAARLNTGLAEQSQMLHVLPSSYQITEGLKLPGTKVLMKAGKQMAKVRQELSGRMQDVRMVENCGMPGEQVYIGTEQIPEDAGYYSIIIVKDGEPEN